ncbi:MAG: hypothetical protein H6584_07960 [Flavobacteriales bacterium]|nr:hypothetical protein [Flavobacteriales bacterium]
MTKIQKQSTADLKAMFDFSEMLIAEFELTKADHNGNENYSYKSLLELNREIRETLFTRLIKLKQN